MKGGRQRGHGPEAVDHRVEPGAAPRPWAGPTVLFGRGTGQLQEDIVERGPAQADVADVNLCPAQPGGRLLNQLEPETRSRQDKPVRALVRLSAKSKSSGVVA